MHIPKFMVILVAICVLATGIVAPVFGTFAKADVEGAERKQMRAIQAFDLFMDGMSTQSGLDCIDKYPDYYAGAYIDVGQENANGDYMLQIDFCSITDEELGFFKDYLKDYADIVSYGESLYSYNKLNEYLNEYVAELQAEGYIIAGYSVNEKNKSLAIDLGSTDSKGNAIDESTFAGKQTYHDLPVEFRFNVTNKRLDNIENNAKVEVLVPSFPTIQVVIGGVVLLCAGVGVGLLFGKRKQVEA